MNPEDNQRVGSISRSLVWRQVVIIVSTVCVFAVGFHFLLVRPALSELIEKHFQTSSDAARDKLWRVFGYVEEALRVNRERMRVGGFDFGDYRQFNTRFAPLLRQNAWISSALYADDEGREILLLERGNDAWTNRLSGLPGANGRSRYLDLQGTEVTREEWRDIGYDPRQRPWYAGALKLRNEREVHWTHPYTFFTTREPGITASLRWQAEDGHVRVLAIDVLLRDLSAITAEIGIDTNGKVAVMTDDGRLLAAPELLGTRTEDLHTALMQPVAVNGQPYLAASYAAWKRSGSPEDRILSYLVGEEKWLARFDGYKLNGTHLWITSMIPANEFSILHGGALSALGGLGLLVLAGGITMALSLSRRFSQPLEFLAAESERIGRLEFENGATVKTRWLEVNRLAAAQSQMRRLLKGATQRLEGTNEELEKRVAVRTQELEMANRELQSFSYSVSHDLRAPLRAINGYSTLLEEDWGDRLDEEARSHLARIRTASEKMGELIDGMLELAQLARKELDPVKVDLSEMAREVVEELRCASPDRQVRVDIEPDLTALADATLLRNVLSNLLGNAWKYSEKTPAPEIAFGKVQQQDEAAYFVRDNGAGFDMQYADKLFQPFQRLHRDSEFAGTGLGLASVRRIVERHGGRIWAEAEKGRGATFYFTLGSPAGGHLPAQ